MSGKTEQTGMTGQEDHSHAVNDNQVVAGSVAPMTADLVKTAYPAVYQAIHDAGAVAERERIRAIEDLAIPGAEDLIAEHKFNPSATEATVSMAIVKHFRDHPERAQASALQQDGKDLAEATKGTGTNAVSPGDAKATEEEAVASMIAKGANQRNRQE